MEALLSAQREQNDNAAAALTEREREIARRGVEIERLRTERDQAERLRGDLEGSYRKLLTDVNEHLRRNTSERSQLRERVVGAEAELQRFREDLQRQTARQQQLSAIHRELSTVVESRQEARGIVLIIPGSSYGHGRSSIASASEGLIRRIGEQLVAHPEVRVTIEGHTDDNGSSEGNLELSQERADGIRDHLILAGVEPRASRRSDEANWLPLSAMRTTKEEYGIVAWK